MAHGDYVTSGWAIDDTSAGHSTPAIGMLIIAYCNNCMCVANVANHMLHASIAQLVEQRTFNPWVVGSNPTGSIDM